MRASASANDGAGFRRPLRGQPNFQGFSLSLTVPDDAEAERLFASLADGGQVQMPLTKTFFSSRFGMVADRFGVPWMVYVFVPAKARVQRVTGLFAASVPRPCDARASPESTGLRRFFTCGDGRPHSSAMTMA